VLGISILPNYWIYELFRQSGINAIHFISSLATENANIYIIVDLFHILYNMAL
jgi:hypothetical protein